MTSRHVLEGTEFKDYTLNYDAENRLVSVTGAATATFVYDADSKQVKTIVNGVTTYYVGNHYEVKNSVVTKYYFAGATRLAVRTGGTLSYLLGDHLGSSSVTTDANGEKTASALYKAFGELRSTPSALGTDYKFTGQREEASLGIYFFNARWPRSVPEAKRRGYDSSLGRFMSPDTIVPTSTQGTQAWDRYAFVNNNPVRYTDPTGHCTNLWNCYTTVWTNFSAAASIYTNPNATIGQRTVAGLYMGTVIAAHVTLAVGVVLAGVATIGATETAITVGEGTCAATNCGEITTPTIDPLTGEPIQRFITNPDGVTVIEPEGGYTGTRPDGEWINTHYPDGSDYQRLDAEPVPHGHGFDQNGNPIDINGNPVDARSPEAHWPIP